MFSRICCWIDPFLYFVRIVFRKFRFFSKMWLPIWLCAILCASAILCAPTEWSQESLALHKSFNALWARLSVPFSSDALMSPPPFYRTNSVKWEADVGGARIPVGHALCPIFSLLCHSCISNTRHNQLLWHGLLFKKSAALRPSLYIVRTNLLILLMHCTIKCTCTVQCTLYNLFSS